MGKRRMRKSVNLEMNAVLVPMKGVVLLIRWAGDLVLVRKWLFVILLATCGTRSLRTFWSGEM